MEERTKRATRDGPGFSFTVSRSVCAKSPDIKGASSPISGYGTSSHNAIEKDFSI